MWIKVVTSGCKIKLCKFALWLARCKTHKSSPSVSVLPCLSNRVFICLYLTEYLYQPLPPPPPLSPSFRSPFGGRLVATKVPVHTQHIRLPLQLQDLSSCGGWDFWRVQQDVTDVLPVCDGKCSLLWLVVQQQSEWHLQLRKPGEEGGLSRWLLYTEGWGSNQRAYGSTGQYLVKTPPTPSIKSLRYWSKRGNDWFIYQDRNMRDWTSLLYQWLSGCTMRHNGRLARIRLLTNWTIVATVFCTDHGHFSFL